MQIFLPFVALFVVALASPTPPSAAQSRVPASKANSHATIEPTKKAQQSSTTLHATALASASASASVCSQYATNTAKFDDIPTNAPPTSNYTGVTWNGFTVVSAPSTGVPVEAASALNVLNANAEGSNIMQGSGSSEMLFGIASFDFACSATLMPGRALPAPCTLMVIAEPFTHVAQIEAFGPYVSTLLQSDGSETNMTHVELNGAFASRFHFSLISGIGMTQLYLDNVVVVQYDSTCLED